MKTKEEIFKSRVNLNGKTIEGMDTCCWEFMPKNKNYKGEGRLSFSLGKGKTSGIGLCGFLFYDGKLPDHKIFSLCKNSLCVRPSHFTDDYGVAYFNEFYKEGVRYKTCSKCGNSYPKTKENFYISGIGVYLTCKSCSLENTRIARAKHWARILKNEIVRRHNQTGIEVGINEEYILQMYKDQDGKCYWTGLELTPSPINKFPSQPSLDRLDNEKGYIPGNVVLCCFAMNMGRNSTPKSIFEAFILTLKEKGINTKLWK